MAATPRKRLPQTVANFPVLIGANRAIGSWAALGVVLVWGMFMRLQVLARYGESHRRFVARVPRCLIVWVFVSVRNTTAGSADHLVYIING
jgi:hypothetical protein